MVKKEYNRLMKSSSTYTLIMLFLIVSIINHSIAFADKSLFVSQLDLDPVLYGIDIEKLKTLIENYNGFMFALNFWFESDFSIVFIIVILLFLGVFLSFQLQNAKESAYGSLLINRMGYKKYLNQIILSQSLYVLSIMTIASILVLVSAMIFGGFGKHTTFSSLESVSWIQSLLILFTQNIFISILMILINALSLLMSTFIKNKYFLQAFPLFVFFIVPQILVSTLGNISGFFADIILPFVLLRETRAISSIVNDWVENGADSFSVIFQYLIPLIVYLSAFIILYIINVKKNEREYL